MNKLLQRQIQKYFAGTGEVPAELTRLFNVISESYDHYEKDRKMIERSVEISSKEMIDLNNRLKQEKEKLRLNEERLRIIIDNEPECVKVVDTNGILLEMNPAGLKMVEADSIEQLKGKMACNLVHPDDKEIYRDTHMRVCRGETVTAVFRSAGLKNKKMWLETHSVPLRNVEGKIYAALSVTRDITEMRAAQELVAMNEKRFRALVENSGDAVTILSAEGLPVYISPSIEKMLGYSENEAKEINLFSLVHPDDLPGVEKSWQHILSTPGIPQPSYACRIRHKNGGWRWMQGTITNMLHDPAINGIVDNFTDITEKMMADQVLRASEEKTRLIMKASMDGIICINTSGIITFWNPQAEKIFGWKGEEVIGHPLAQNIIPDWDGHVHETGAKNYLKSDEPPLLNVVFESIALNYKQKEFPVELTIIPVKQRGGEFYCVFIRDITQKKIAEQDKEFERKNLEALINNTNDLMWSVDRDFRLISSNQPFDEIVRQMIGKTIKPGDDILAAESESAELDHFKQFYERAFTGEIFMEIEHSDVLGDPWSEISFYPIRNGDSIIGTACYSRDITSKLKAEKLIREERRLLRTLVDNLPLNVYTKDIHSKITLANRAELAYIGASSEKDVLGKSDYDLHMEESAKTSLADDQRVFTSGESIIGCENHHVTKNGTAKWFLKSKIPLKNENNEITGLLGISYDITERKKVEEILQKKTDELIAIKNELEESEKSLKEAQTTAGLGNWVFDLTTYVTKWSEETYRIFGLKNNEIPTSPEAFLSFIHPDDRERIKAIIEKGESSLQGYSFNCRIIRPNGVMRYIYSNCRFILNSEGKPLRISGITHDITERNMAEEQLRYSESRLKEAQAIAHVGSWEMNLLTRKGFWSDEACRIYGLPVGENEQTFASWLSFIHPDDLENVKSEVQKGGETLSGSSIYHRIIRRDGSIRFLYTASKYQLDHQGKPVGIYGIAHDVTERKHNQQQLKSLNEQLVKRAEELADSNAELERFAYVASHDLQEPLRMVSSFLQLLQKKYNEKLDSTATQYIGYAVDGSDRMKKLILDLLEYSRVGTNQDKFTNIDIGDLVGHAMQTFDAKIREAGVVVNIQPLPVIKANQMQMTQLFQNLIGNALKYNNATIPGIKIGCEEKEDSWEFFVEDNGIGIEQKYFDRVFAIFQRLHNRNEYSGTGIGLAICKKIVEKHNGNIWIESIPGNGTTFFFTIKKQP